MQVGEQVGRYQVVGGIGKGGMGAVYRAVDASTPGQEELALKVLSRDGGTASVRDLVLWGRELEALSAVGHPNIVRLLDFGEEGGRFFLVMDFVDGPSLDEFCRARRVGAQLAVRLARQLTAALMCAHGSNIIHLDLKPQNILLQGDPPTVKILDFGLARYVSEFPSEQSAAVSGTFAYMAPEQFGAFPAELGPHTDLYALGVMLFEMLSDGQTPYDTSDTGELIRRKLAGQRRRLKDIAPGTPAALDRLVDRLLAPDTTQRYCSARGVLHDLDLCLEQLDAGAAGFDFQIGEQDHKPVSAMDVRFIGRAAELNRLVELYGECGRGKGQLVFVTGPTGIGKSRLVRELTAALVRDGSPVWAGKSSPQRSGYAFALFSDVLTKVFNVSPTDTQTRSGTRSTK